MKKIIQLGIWAAVLIACCIILGMFFYQEAQRVEQENQASASLKWALPLSSEYDGIYLLEGDGLVGYKNSNQVPIKLDGINVDKYAHKDDYEVKRENSTEIVTYKGKTVYKGDYKNHTLYQIEDNLYGYSMLNRDYVIDVLTGDKVADVTGVIGIVPLGNGLYGAEDKDESYRILDKNFKAINDVKYESVGVYADGLCPIESKGKTGYIDKNGKLIIDIEAPIYMNNFSEGKAIVYYEDRVACIDIKGKILYTIGLNSELVKKEEASGDYETYSTYVNGNATIFDGEMVGTVNEKGVWQIKPTFDEIELIGGNLAVVRLNNRDGIIFVK